MITLLNNYQSKLFPYAYNILGDSDDAHDAIQDVVLKYTSLNKEVVDNELNYLIRGVINQSINIKKRNKKNVGDTVWLPEPVATERADANIKKNEIISYSMLVLLEYLNPKERAVFILKEAFDYSHEEIADTLSISVENSRKLLSRAKNELKTSSANFKTTKPAATASSVLQRYIQIIKDGDIKALEQVLSSDIDVRTDGGDKIKIVSPLTTGFDAVAQLMLYVFENYQKDTTIKITEVNHQPAFLFLHDGEVVNCQVFELDATHTQIVHIYSVVDPDKLKTLNS
jgi:RNA polymerase sigma factor (sigma-70 family)